MFTVFEDEKPCVIDIALYIYIYHPKYHTNISAYTLYLFVFIWFPDQSLASYFFDIICILFWQQKLVTQWRVSYNSNTLTIALPFWIITQWKYGSTATLLWLMSLHYLELIGRLIQTINRCTFQEVMVLETDIFLKLETLIYINHFFEQPFFHPKKYRLCVF